MKEQYFEQYKQRARNIGSVNELLPGLNDISDAFEALPLELIKYFTLLKEIDAKYINSVPIINHNIKSYLDKLHDESETGTLGSTETQAAPNGAANGKDSEAPQKNMQLRRLTLIRNKLHEIVPCLEEKMHVASVATDVLHKHIYRINNDYKLIIHNNEIPESIRIGPLNHPAMIMDPTGDSASASAQSQRSESRRVALAARKAGKESTEDEDPKKKKTPHREGTPNTDSAKQAANAKKRPRKENEEISRPGTPASAAVSQKVPPAKKKNPSKSRKDEKDPVGDYGANAPHASNSSEPTYCYCNQVSFGEMVGCDGDDCKREWFHLPCIGFKNPPKGKWYCDDCLATMKKIKKI